MKKRTGQEKNVIYDISLDYVYEPPEHLGESKSLDGGAGYPAVHAVTDGKGKSTNADTDETVRFCENCRYPFPMSEAFCPACGHRARAGRTEAPPMACVYASPERMRRAKPKERKRREGQKEPKGLLSRFFRRKP